MGTASSSGTLISDANAKLVIESISDGTGSLICGGIPNATVERYVNKNVWHLVTQITNVSTANDFYIDASNASWLTYHQESDNSFDNYITDLETSLNRNEGYAYWIDNAASANTVSFTGTLIGANQSPSLA